MAYFFIPALRNSLPIAVKEQETSNNTTDWNCPSC